MRVTVYGTRCMQQVVPDVFGEVQKTVMRCVPLSKTNTMSAIQQ